MNATTYGLDVAKRVFQMYWVDGETGEIVNHRFGRDQLIQYLSRRPPGRVAMEACGSAHWWARKIKALGHHVVLMHAKFVRPFVQTNKTDAADARAIWTAVQQPAQLSLTDRDARSMMSQAKGTGVVGYNVQTAVDAKHHLIVAHEVTNVGSDRAQLSKMALAARQAMGKTKLQAIADRGYYNAPEIKACDDSGIAACVPKPMTSNAKADGRFDKSDFIYIAEDDEYQCPAGQRAIYRFTREENGLQLRRYWSSACPQCPIKAKCTPSQYRRISRWEHEAVLEAVQRRMDKHLDAMTLRRRTIEHVFGTLKHWMGSVHFLTRRLTNVTTEMSLHVLAYNLKRVISILGIARTMKAMQLVGV